MKVFSCLQHVVRETHFFLKHCAPGANPAITLLPFPLGERNSFKPKARLRAGAWQHTSLPGC